MFNAKNKGFTLVELIVVIVILAILATIAFLSFTSQSSSARDSTRLADTASLKKGLELYQVNSGMYPLPENITGTGKIGIEELSYVGSIKDSISRLIKINKAPIDPSGSNNHYAYGVSYDKRYYQIGTILENPIAFNYNPFITFVSAAAIYQAKVSGNYNGLLKKNTTIYNLPSLLFSNQGSSVDLASASTFFVADKSTNLTYSPDSSVLNNTQAPLQILNLIGASGTSLSVTGITITDVAFWKANSGAIVTSLGYPVDSIGVAYYGSVKYNEIKGPNILPPAGPALEYFPGLDGISGNEDDCNSPNISVGTQVWSACNIGATTSNLYNTAVTVDTKPAYDSIDCITNGTTNGADCLVVGKLYSWNQTMVGTTAGQLDGTDTTSKVKGICPTGWHLPSFAEIDAAYEIYGNGTYGNASNLPTVLKMPKASYYDNTYHYYGQGSYGFYWTSAAFDVPNAWRMHFTAGSVDHLSYEGKGIRFSVRCIKG